VSARVRVGTAGWALPRGVRERFGDGASNLARYATRFTCGEINSSFYRPHRPTVYARWAASTPPDFRFAVKVPKAITHGAKLVDTETLLDAFLAEAGGLGDRLGPLLVQLAPKHALDEEVAGRFFAALRARHAGPVAFEPRHASWFSAAATDLLVMHRIARVATDPAKIPAAADPGGDASLVYFRLHGSPRTYWSSYEDPYLDALALRLRDAAASANGTWCIFDNTASGAAAANALSLCERLR
jgi:uncharacterized protein YecE (DUF72 family)